MVVCICGHETMTEGELLSHIIECHTLSYGLTSLKAVTVPDDKKIPVTVA